MLLCIRYKLLISLKKILIIFVICSITGGWLLIIENVEHTVLDVVSDFTYKPELYLHNIHLFRYVGLALALLAIVGVASHHGVRCKLRKIYSAILWSIFAITVCVFIVYYVSIKTNLVCAENRDFEKIHLNQLESLSYNKHTGLIYIGRNTCPTCQEVEPILLHFSNIAELKILYYNTEQDRHDNSKIMTDVLNNYNVYSVPMLLLMENGNITESFFSETLVKDMEAWLFSEDPCKRWEIISYRQ